MEEDVLLFWISQHSCMSYDPVRDDRPLGPLTPSWSTSASVGGKHGVQMDVPAAAADAACSGAGWHEHGGRHLREAQGDLEVEG